ncbi:MAG: hypothetical protein GX581_07900 [Syntrophomonadaceae bacterium]|nr:hypothetical protein [Syntrophomonadaceae bacterium]
MKSAKGLPRCHQNSQIVSGIGAAWAGELEGGDVTVDSLLSRDDRLKCGIVDSILAGLLGKGDKRTVDRPCVTIV